MISSIGVADAATVITVIGDIDLATTARVRAALMWRVRTGERTVVLDLCRITFFGLAGLDVLIDAQAVGCETGRRILFATGTGCVNRVLSLTGLSTTMTTHPTLAAALADVVTADPHPATG